MSESTRITVTPRRRLRWYQLSLRAFLLLVLAFCVWLGMTVQRARRQEEIVRKITAHSRNFVIYAHEVDDDGMLLPSVVPPGPDWLRRQIGDHFFFRPKFVSLLEYDDALLREAVQLRGVELMNLANANDERLLELRTLPGLRKLDVASPYVTRKGLADLARLKRLEHLSVRGAWITDDDLKLLAPLRRLKDLNVSDTQVTSEGIAWLKQAWPQLPISALGFPAGRDGAIVRGQFSGVNARFDATPAGEVLGCNLLGKESTDEELLRLAALPHLRMVCLFDTSVTADGVLELCWLRPEVSVRPNLLGPAPDQAELADKLERLGLSVTLDDYGRIIAISSNSINISDADLKLVTEAPALTRVSSDSPSLTDLAIEFVGTTGNQTEILLPNAEITDRGILQLKAHERLRRLALRGAGITDAGLVALADKRRLQFLELKDVRLASDGLRHLASCPRLRQLDLTGAQLSPGALAYLVQATSLQSLTLDRTTIADGDLKDVSLLRQLRSVSLIDTAITDAGLLSLHALGSLKVLRLEGTPVTDEGVQAIKSALPACRVSK